MIRIDLHFVLPNDGQSTTRYSGRRVHAGMIDTPRRDALCSRNPRNPSGYVPCLAPIETFAVQIGLLFLIRDANGNARQVQTVSGIRNPEDVENQVQSRARFLCLAKQASVDDERSREYQKYPKRGSFWLVIRRSWGHFPRVIALKSDSARFFLGDRIIQGWKRRKKERREEETI
ncbi:hypothetical protein K0M31_013080 [Melipona bicolor]|uniref:Uncharacterized protein n=1 Tax=Melipona bicolor TaxID=60889 RepID=A0AA40KGK1_9HYME|nr:hypothetical protein K0M31_013080 [Melipona bicolor]